MNRKTSLLLGFARRMEQVAKLAAEMQDIRTAYTREFGAGWDEELKNAMSGDRLARLLAELRAERPEPPQSSEENVLEGAPDTAPPAGAPALGLAPMPSLPGWPTDEDRADHEAERYRQGGDFSG